MTPEAGRTRAHERLRRLLLLVPFIARNQGKSVDDVAQQLGLTRAELLEDLERVTLIGRPPFAPGDYVDVYVEDDRVYVELDQRLNAPPRFTAAEGVALAAAASLLKPAAGGALQTAITKLTAVLPPHAAQRFEELSRRLDVTQQAPETATALTQAIATRVEVEFDYRAVTHDGHERRRVQPYELTLHRGVWYLNGYCLARQDTRLFRLDRMGGLTVTSTPCQPPQQALKQRAASEVKVRFSPRVAAWQKEQFGAASLAADGSLTVTVPGDSPAWLARWVLSFGGDAVVVEPHWAKRAVAEAARASLR